MTRFAALLAPALLLSAAATAKDDVPLSAAGLPFAPAAPEVLPADHPLYHAIALTPVAEFPGKAAGAKQAEIDAAVADMLARLQMLAPEPSKAKFRLTPRWLGLDSPFRISFASHAAARMSWRLTRTDSGLVLFDREIATAAQSTGGSATERRRGVERVAVMTNIASAARCLDLASYGEAPADCALTPRFTYRAPSPPMIMFIRR